jgi:hypothetical protein
MELTTFGSKDGELMLLLNNGTSMVFQRLSETTIGRATHLISNQMVDQTILDAQALTQDGGKCSDSKTITLSMREERLWKLSAMSIKRTETLE